MLIKPVVGGDSADSGQGDVIASVTAEQAGWDYLNCEVRRLATGDTWSQQTDDHELGLVILGGICSIESNRGQWPHVGARPNVFAGMPYGLYLPPQSNLTVTALTDGFEAAACSVPAERDHPAQLVTPAHSQIEVRGGHNATRQINTIFPPGFDCQRLVAVEVYTPGGNWSSYPPHKHDVHREDDQGNVIEADLEEIYYYKIDKPNGYAIQRVYNDDRSLDAVMVPHNNSMVLVPYGYHPVSAAYGYNCYYLNFLAGSAQSLANSDDPDYAWTKETWTGQDPRIPLVNHGMTPGV